MAFVKVIRRSMRPEEWTDLRFNMIKKALIVDKIEINDLYIRDARQIGENEYIYLNEYRPFNRGDIYFVPDGTVFIKGHGKIPKKFKDSNIYLMLHTAAEMIVKINGRYAGGIDPNRDRILLNPWLYDDDLSIEIEGYNRSKPDDERNPDAMDSRGCRQIFEGAFICTVNEELLNLFYDLTLLLDIAKSDEFDPDYREFLNRELNNALNLMDFDNFTGIHKATAYIQDKIYSNTDFRSSGDVALIGHSHLDIAYYWRRMHVVQKNARTVLIQMRLMDKYPDFKYTHTQPYTYELLKNYYPDLYSELKEKIKSGQFEPVGAMYVEPDCNIPCGESLIRQCLYGQQFYRKEFGITVDNAWLPDVFGNSWILPQILKKSGVDFFVSNKMSTWNDTNRFPHNNFLWKGIDGSEIYACVPPTHFITWNMPSQIMENWNAYQDKECGGQTLSMFGYGDGGSGVTEEMVELMHRFDKLSVMPKTEHVSAHDFLHNNFYNNPNLSTWDGELYLEMHRGTFTTKSNLKFINRKLEFRLRTAEIYSVFKYLNENISYPGDTIRNCYKKLLLNQFHDILPGSHINPVYHDAMDDYNIINKELDNLLQYNTGNIYFNSLSFDLNEIHFIPDDAGYTKREGKKGFFAYTCLPALTSGSIDNKYITPNTDSDWINIIQDADGNLNVSTPLYNIRFNPDGSISSLSDSFREWTAGDFNKLHIYQDLPGMYDAWDILPNYKEKEYIWNILSPLSTVYINEFLAEFSVTLSTGNSKWTTIIRVFKNSEGIEVEHIADWHEKHKLVKASFECNILSRELICDTSAGYIKRKTHKNTTWQQARFEVCHHKWCDFSEEGGGIAIINRGKYGVSPEVNGMSLSLLRANIRPDVESDMGTHHICYMILPHEGNHVFAGINRRAFEYNVELLPVKTAIETDKNSSLSEILKAVCKHPNLFLQAIKLSESGEYIILRLSEQDGKRAVIKFNTEVTVFNLIEDITGSAYEIKYSPFEFITIGIKI